MCVAVPGKVIRIKENYATIDIMGNQCQANIALVEAKIGDYVLMHAGCVIEVLKRDTAEDILSLFAQMEEAVNE